MFSLSESIAIDIPEVISFTDHTICSGGPLFLINSRRLMILLDELPRGSHNNVYQTNLDFCIHNLPVFPAISHHNPENPQDYQRLRFPMQFLQFYHQIDKLQT